MQPGEFFTDRPEQWRMVLDFVRRVKEGRSAGCASETGRFPSAWQEGKTKNTIWDSELFGDLEGGKENARWGHLQVHHAVHPVCFGPIGELLGLSAEEVRLICWWRGTVIEGEYASMSFPTDHASGPRFLKELLSKLPLEDLPFSLDVHPSELVFDVLPIPPRWMRPPKAAHGQTLRPAPEDLLFNALVFQSKIVEFFWEDEDEEVPSLRLLFEHQSSMPIQRLLEQVVHLYRSPKGGNRWDFERSWSLNLPAGEGEEGVYGEDPEMPDVIHPGILSQEWEDENMALWVRKRQVPLKLFPIGDGRLFVQFEDRILVLGGLEGDLLKTVSTFGQLLGLAEDEAHLYYKYFGQLCILNLDSEVWLEGIPAESFRFIDSFELEGTFMGDVRRGQVMQLGEVKDEPYLLARCREGRFVWVEDRDVNGGIYDLKTGWLEMDLGLLEAEEAPPLLGRDGKLAQLSPAAMEIMEETLAEAAQRYRELKIREKASQHALALIGGHWWIFAFNTLWVDMRPVWRVDMPVTAAAFDKNGRRLFLANMDEARSIEMDVQGRPIQVRLRELPFT